jgi:hypothetical protein
MGMGGTMGTVVERPTVAAEGASPAPPAPPLASSDGGDGFPKAKHRDKVCVQLRALCSEL